MSSAVQGKNQNELLDSIVRFIGSSSGLKTGATSAGALKVVQVVDQKSIEIKSQELEDVLSRTDSDGREFIQVNFLSGKKILLTDSLIGFKPQIIAKFDMTRVPKVVTTPDLMSIFDAIQDALDSSEGSDEEILVLRRVFESVLSGGESIGFNLTVEKSWLGRLPSVVSRASA